MVLTSYTQVSIRKTNHQTSAIYYLAVGNDLSWFKGMVGHGVGVGDGGLRGGRGAGGCGSEGWGPTKRAICPKSQR